MHCFNPVSRIKSLERLPLDHHDVWFSFCVGKCYCTVNDAIPQLSGCSRLSYVYAPRWKSSRQILKEEMAENIQEQRKTTHKAIATHFDLAQGCHMYTRQTPWSSRRAVYRYLVRFAVYSIFLCVPSYSCISL